MTDIRETARSLKDYRPQHDHSCARRKCGTCDRHESDGVIKHPDCQHTSIQFPLLARHAWRQMPCSCGLDALLRDVDPPAGTPSKTCHICQKQQHAKWHDESNGEIVNPISLLEFVESLPVSDARDCVHRWVAYIAGIDRPLPAALSSTHESITK